MKIGFFKGEKGIKKVSNLPNSTVVLFKFAHFFLSRGQNDSSTLSKQQGPEYPLHEDQHVIGKGAHTKHQLDRIRNLSTCIGGWTQHRSECAH